MSIFKKLKLKIKSLFFKKLQSTNSIYYINGPDVLPAPLSVEEEAKIISELSTGESAKAILIERNLRLVVYIAKKFESTGIYIEDLVSIGTIGLVKAINTFRAEKNIKLATYASRCIENEILMYIRKNNSTKCEISIDEPLSVDWDGNELLLSDILGDEEYNVGYELEKREEREVIHKAVEGLNSRERTIIEWRYGLNGKKEKTQKEVADMMGISQSYISRLEKRIIDRLRVEVEGKI